MFARSSSSSHLGARDLSLDFYSFPVPQLVDFLHRCYKRQTQICNNVAQSWQKISTWRKRKSRMHYWLIIFLSNFDRISHADEIARIGGCADIGAKKRRNGVEFFHVSLVPMISIPRNNCALDVARSGTRKSPVLPYFRRRFQTLSLWRESPPIFPNEKLLASLSQTRFLAACIRDTFGKDFPISS